MTESEIVDWARGDLLGLDLPTHIEALREGGPGFLTRAFHASGVLARDNAVRAITRLDAWNVGGTGAKAMLSVAYARDEPGLSRDLFVKFSRNFADKTRDRVKHFLASEVKLANLSRDPAFPVAAPNYVYADFHRASGSGVLITDRIRYGEPPIEPHFHKGMDHLLPEPEAYYRVLMSTLALLSGAHKSGRLGPAADRDFPLDLEALAGQRSRFDEAQLTMRVDRLIDFITRYPHLFPPELADPAFLAGFRADAPRFIAQQDAISRFHYAQPDMIALCHWNANIDNGWFWREPDGTLKCGLIDWANVGQMHVCRSIWGSLSLSEPEMIDRSLADLLALFIADYARAGGPRLDQGELERHLDLDIIASGLASLVAPRAIVSEVPDPSLAADRFDPLFAAHETARVQLKVTIGFLNMWRRRDLGRLLREGPFRRG
jgi:hypothetical protein